jgi:hypothetical protein
MKKIANFILTVFLLSLISSSIAFAQSPQQASLNSAWGSFFSHPIDFMSAQYRGVDPVTQTSLTSQTATGRTPTNYDPSGGLGGLLKWLGQLLRLILPLIISAGVVYFIWNVFQYSIAGDEDKKAKAKNSIIWGIGGIFVMVSVWGLVGILSSSFRLNTTNSNAPDIQVSF